MQFEELAKTLEEIEKVSSRLRMTDLLARMWRQLQSQEARQTANLIQGQLLPPYEALEFNLSEKMVARALVKLVRQNGGLTSEGLAVDLFGEADDESVLAQVKNIHRESGDWGEAASQIHQRLFPQRASALTIATVYERLIEIARVSGEGSQELKLEMLAKLYSEVGSVSAKIVTRIVVGKLRLGFSLMTILDSLSWAGTEGKSESSALEEIFQKKADIGLLAQSYLELLTRESSERLRILQENYHVAVGVPVVPALCQRLNSSQEIIDKMEEVIAEPKYDGIRIQIHIKKKQVMAFTRSLENVSEMFPELQKLAEVLPVESVILDSEALGYNKQTGEILPFQEIMTRRRKYLITEKAREVPIKFQVFDVLYLDGKELLEASLTERKQLLGEIVQESEWAHLAPFIVTKDADELHQYHTRQLELGLEGMVAKAKKSKYQSGRKGWNWVKIKEAEGSRGKLNDTLDLLVMGVYAGKGKRHGFGVGAFLVGLMSQAGEVVTISKIGTGLTDDDFRELKQRGDQLAVKEKPSLYQVNKMLTPDIWLNPGLVAEIAADEITKSTNHTSGCGLRFPRLIRWRDDKSFEQITTSEQLKAIRIA